MRISILVLGTLAVVCGGACAGGTSPGTPAPPVGGASAVAPTAELDGHWILVMALDGGMEFAIKVDIEPRDDRRFEAYSRGGAAAELVSAPVALLGRLLGRMPPRGAVLYMTDGVATRERGEVQLRGRLRSPLLGQFFLTGALNNGRLSGELWRDTLARPVGRVGGVPHPRDHAARDYPALAARLRSTVENVIYDPHLVERPEWRAFFRALEAGMAHARDDADAMVAFYAARRRIRMSHFDLFRNPAIAGASLDSLMAGGPDPASLVSLAFMGGVAFLHVSSWNDVTAAVGRAFERIDSAGSHTLVLDVRGNPGGDVSSAAPAAHLLRDSTYIGVFLGRAWYADHRSSPTGAQLESIPVLADERATSVLQGVREHGALRGIVPPRTPHFAGTAYLLIDGNSGSASEPLAQLLRETGRATLVGERTAGAMLSAPPHSIAEGWVLQVPEADYYAAGGSRLEGRGVEPHVRVRGADAPLAVADRLQAGDPLAAAMLRGRTHVQHARWANAAHAYGDAVRLAGARGDAGLGLGRALQELGRWDEAVALYEAMLAADPAEVGAAYQIGRAAALSGTRLALGERMLRRYLEATPRAEQPSHAAAYWRLGEILAALGRAEEAVQAWHAALELEPGHAGARAALARLGTRPQ